MTIDELEKEMKLAGWWKARNEYVKRVDRGFYNVIFVIDVTFGNVSGEVQLSLGSPVILGSEWYGALSQLHPGFVLEATQSLAKNALDRIGLVSQLLAETAMTGSVPA